MLRLRRAYGVRDDGVCVVVDWGGFIVVVSLFQLAPAFSSNLYLCQ